MENCIFCSIIKGDAGASVVYSDDKALAFMDIRPVNAGHVLIVPKIHAAQLADLDETVGSHIFKIAMRLDAALRRSGVKCEGVMLLLADGEAAFQDIFHVHLHVIPRFKGDGFSFRFGPDYGKRQDRKELESIAEKIRGAFR